MKCWGGRRLATAASMIVLSVALSGCLTLEPDHPVPSVDLPATYRNDKTAPESPPSAVEQKATRSVAAANEAAASEGDGGQSLYGKVFQPFQPPPLQLPRLKVEWWRQFHSPELDRLIDQALADNHDLGAAIARVEEAQAQSGEAAGALLPTIQATGSAESSYPFGGPGTPEETAVGRVQTERLYQMAGSASYELDFWGKNRSTLNAAVAATRSSIYDRDTVALSLVAAVTTAYLQYLEASDRIAVAKSNTDAMADVLDIVRKRNRVGEGTQIEIQQQATELAQAKASIPPLAIQREQARDQLATLVGIPPEELQLTGASLDSLMLPATPDAVPSQLLAARPDIRKAEADIIGANDNIGVARAQLLPDFTLQGQRGVGSQFVDTLLSPSSFFFMLVANASQTLFDNGKLLSQLDYSKAVYREKVETYRQAILSALKDVEDALAEARLTRDEEDADIDAAVRSQSAYVLVQKAFRTGTVSYLTILDIERTEYQAEDARVQARFDRLNAATTLFQGLGGGVETPAADH